MDAKGKTFSDRQMEKVKEIRLDVENKYFQEKLTDHPEWEEATRELEHLLANDPCYFKELAHERMVIADFLSK